jgi:uncharacterized protein (TIGR03118 family)
MKHRFCNVPAQSARERRRQPIPAVEVLEHRRLLSASHAFITQTNLVSDQPGVATITDPNLINAWGVSFAPGAEFWISANNSGFSLQYNGDGTAAAPPMVTIPGGGGANPSNPTGNVFAGGNMSFNGTPEVFAFVGEDGAISAWNGSGTTATLIHDNSPGAVYKGATLSTDANGNDELLAANFRAGTVEAYDHNFAPVSLPTGAFQDKKIPKGYAPFNVQDIGGDIYVTYAKQNSLKHDDVKGAGHGYVDVFNTGGQLIRRFAHGSFLNSPWGVSVAPSTWGSMAGDILVGQFGDGRIDLFNTNGKFLGFLKNSKNKPIVIDHLWALTPGSGSATASPNSIFFTAGPDDENHGLFGKLDFTVATATAPHPSPSPSPTPIY